MNNNNFINLTTERLFLRELQPQDAEEIFLLRSNEAVNEFVDRNRAATIADAVEFIQKIRALGQNGEGIYWAITLRRETKLIGAIVYWNIVKEKKQAEIGYELLPEYQGNGIMTEALEKVIAFGFDELGYKTIVADPNKRNVRSIHLLEKLGFNLSGEAADGYLMFELQQAK